MALWVLTGSLAVTALLWHQASVDAEREVRSVFEHDVADIKNHLEKRLLEQDVLLKGFVGIFNASPKVTRQDFHAYYTAYGSSSSVSGQVGVSYIEQVSAKNLKRHITEVRRNTWPGYQVRPISPRQVYAPIVYIEPQTPNQLKVLGFDVYTAPAEQPAMARARDNATLSMSAKLTLKQDAGTDVPGFVIYEPVYRYGAQIESLAQRQANFLGWVDIPFRMAEFVTSTLPDGIKNIDLEIFDGSTPSQASLMYDKVTLWVSTTHPNRNSIASCHWCLVTIPGHCHFTRCPAMVRMS